MIKKIYILSLCGLSFTSWAFEETSFSEAEKPLLAKVQPFSTLSEGDLLVDALMNALKELKKEEQEVLKDFLQGLDPQE